MYSSSKTQNAIALYNALGCGIRLCVDRCRGRTLNSYKRTKINNTGPGHVVIYRQNGNPSHQTDDNGNAMLQSFISKLSKNKSAEDTLVPPPWKNFFFFFGHAAGRGGTCAFTLKIMNTLSKTAHSTIGLISRHRINPRPTRFVAGKANECR